MVKNPVLVCWYGEESSVSVLAAVVRIPCLARIPAVSDSTSTAVGRVRADHRIAAGSSPSSLPAVSTLVYIGCANRAKDTVYFLRILILIACLATSPIQAGSKNKLQRLGLALIRQDVKGPRMYTA